MKRPAAPCDDRDQVLAAVSKKLSSAASKSLGGRIVQSPTDRLLQLTQTFIEKVVQSRCEPRRRERMENGKRPARVTFKSVASWPIATLTDANLRNPQGLLAPGGRGARAFLGAVINDGWRVREQEDDCMHRPRDETEQLWVKAQDVHKLVLVGKIPVLRSAERGINMISCDRT